MKKKNAPKTDFAHVANKPVRWDLTQLYPGLHSEELSADFSHAEEMLRIFSQKHKGKISTLNAPDLASVISRYEEIQSLCSRLSGYILLLDAENIRLGPKTETYWRKISDLEEGKSFLVSELRQIPEREMMAKMANSSLARYASWIANVRNDYDTSLAPGVRSLRDAYMTHHSERLNRLYVDTIADIRVKSSGEDQSLSAVESLAADEDLPLQSRKKLRQSMADAVKDNGHKLAFIFNQLMQDNNIDAQHAGFPRVEREHVSSSGFDPDITDQMTRAMRQLYARTSHRFYAWLAKSHGKESIHVADLDKPPADIRGKDPKISFSRARDLIFQATRSFSPKMGDLLREIFDEKRIDASSSIKKSNTAFARFMGLSSGSFISLDYTGRKHAMTTMAHELGHGVHMDSMRRQGLELNTEMSNHIGEIPSVFAELLTMNAYLEQERDPARRKSFMLGSVEDMIDTGMKQFSYYDFEVRVHKKRKAGPMSFEQISDIWAETRHEYYGPSVVLDDYDRYGWALTEHFVSTPFYVSTYPFALAVASSLMQQYEEAKTSGKEAAQAVVNRYIDFLETGSTKTLKDVFQSLGVDPYTPDFWEKSTLFIERHIAQLEEMEVSAAPSKRRGAAVKPK